MIDTSLRIPALSSRQFVFWHGCASAAKQTYVLQGSLFGWSLMRVEIWPTGVAGERAVPPDVQEELGRALYVYSP